MQERILAYKKLEYSKHTQEKLHIELYIQKYGKKIYNFTPKNILLYSPQRDKVLSTFKKEVKNGGTK
jgi:hypothetical protein